MSLGIHPQGTSIGKGYQEMAPYTALAYRPYTDPPPPPQGGWWGGLNAPKYVLPLSMGHERTGCQVDSALSALYPLAEYLPIGDSPSHHSPSVGLR